MTDRNEISRVHAALFGGAPRFFFAPGRVNLIGDHADYNDGFVLPMALTEGTLVAGVARDSRKIRAHSVNTGETREFDLDRPGESRPADWAACLLGTARELESAGIELTGADLVLSSDIPIGSGLSSAAALEISSGMALVALSGRKVDRLVLARAGSDAERPWAGFQSGIDQFASVFGMKDNALLIDCRLREITPIPLDTSRAAIILCDSQEEIEPAGPGHNWRREECRRAVRKIRAAFPKWNVESLRDVDALAIESFDAGDVAMRRAWHVINENGRTLRAARALGTGDYDTVGRLMLESHESLRRFFEVSTPRLDFLVDAARRIRGVHGARMTGNGPGGCTINLVARECRDDFLAAMSQAWTTRFGSAPLFHAARAGDGAAELAA